MIRSTRNTSYSIGWESNENQDDEKNNDDENYRKRVQGKLKNCGNKSD